MGAAPQIPQDRLMVALDVPDVAAAEALISKIGDAAGVYKIGLELLFSGGFALVERLAGDGTKIFVDAKLLDIGATVERATAAIARSGAAFLTVHAIDRKTLDAAVRGKGKSELQLLGVTVLTNLDHTDLQEQGIDAPPRSVVQQRADMALAAGFDGVVASGLEAAALRERLREPFKIVTPGIRPAGASADDQSRIVTPTRAIEAGADYLVVGRPITRAEDPRAAAEAICAEIAEALGA
ncbi:orotidine-5'-phosphate decarboxylase [Methyloligella sp. 2.7D]|uniref:orotidine-5'-phosphate decarboxylase n=1 Tax=unclassified Methyloligella TaxID=2625955 RepID=UPI00157C1553|nr:orotidine-5'-phosphate decarboxylase [Methyloligella sp. GL2]QKP76168.1 orotidine-5'-phosphate decarboxylase [Methyloligella sp. GL2]